MGPRRRSIFWAVIAIEQIRAIDRAGVSRHVGCVEDKNCRNGKIISKNRYWLICELLVLKSEVGGVGLVQGEIIIWIPRDDQALPLSRFRQSQLPNKQSALIIINYDVQESTHTRLSINLWGAEAPGLDYYSWLLSKNPDLPCQMIVSPFFPAREDARDPSRAGQAESVNAGSIGSSGWCHNGIKQCVPVFRGFHLTLIWRRRLEDLIEYSHTNLTTISNRPY